METNQICGHVVLPASPRHVGQYVHGAGTARGSLCPSPPGSLGTAPCWGMARALGCKGDSGTAMLCLGCSSPRVWCQPELAAPNTAIAKL